MSEEKFNNKYNSIKTGTKLNCSGCGLELTFMSTPSFGGGKLKEGGRVCRDCFKKIVKINASFGMKSKVKYNVNDVKKLLDPKHNNSNSIENSIIEVSETLFNITIDKEQDNHDIPYWSHVYVYSYNDLNYANKDQKKFYFKFKDHFLKGENIPIDGNTNYAFILYFDLLKEYEKHNDIQLLEQQFKQLGECCPKTKSYALDALRNLLRDKGDPESLEKAIELQDDRYQYEYGFSDYDPDAYKLGRLYKEKLDLNKQQVSWLNKFYNPSNVFLSIEGCCIATINYYLLILKELSKQLKKNHTTLAKEIKLLKEQVLLHYKEESQYQWGSYELGYYSSEIENNLYLNIFKKAENEVRNLFGHKRKISAEFPYQYAETAFEDKIGIALVQIMEEMKLQISSPDHQTQIELNAQNVNRWKTFFNQLKIKLIEGNQKEFILGITDLEKVNQKNPNIEHIFYEASKAIAKQNQIVALQYYAKYIYYDLKSKKIDNKPINKTLQKLLFKTDEQLSSFREIISQLILNKDIKLTLNQITKIYEPKRKKIVLDIQAIKKVEAKHSDTVELLNQYLINDETTSNIEVYDTKNEKTTTIKEFDTKKDASIFIQALVLSEMQKEVLFKIAKNDFSVSMGQIEILAMEKGMFKNQLIDSINDSCAEFLDGEALIEEEDNSYIIEESYYNELLK
ncbi:hypothetical protein A8C32_18080 [Flavivirga aquatica]|uniref:TerB-C domain-containing protein n=2 Tax=Flavivirga aquatica TaxID=1849968 RepID=A0A1E5T7I7_9FLAO|nr:hypothetical protein A8C32_18080 [Flavivirga aquatica]